MGSCVRETAVKDGNGIMSTRFTEEWLSRRLAKQGADRSATIAHDPKRNKYRSVKTDVDGVVFDSKKEAGRWQELVLLERAGEISNLARQIKFPLEVNGEHICNYFADFCYDDSDGNVIVEDVKGVRTKEYRVKAKLMKALYKIAILET